MPNLRVAFLWHHHQPCYRDLLTGVFRMPWVRLHGTKDYYGLARLLEEAGGGVHATINLVPSLVEQIGAYARGEAKDLHLCLSTRRAEDLTAEEKARALDLFFMADRDRMIAPLPRYRELYEKRRPGRFPASQVAADFTVADLRDLQLLANLAWFHRTLFETDEDLRALRLKGRDFTEVDKEFLFRRQREVVAGVLPLHRRLMERGIVELTAGPYCHPILPLLVNTECAREGLPGTPLPAGRTSLLEDAREHLRRAVKAHEDAFGARPRGLWPSEGSVSPGILPLVREAGFLWLASDQEVLAESLGRGAYGEADLYRAWRAPAPIEDLSLLFRDHRLSDLIGFSYRGMDGEAAAADLIGRLRDIGRRHAGDEALATIILDGENPWEHYPDGGIRFLRSLFRRLASDPDLSTVRVSDHLEHRPPTRRLPRLRSGSWINADFAIWIGHPDDVRCWEYLYRVREDFVRLSTRPGTTPEAVELARRCLLVAEGSDWAWWYGEDHTSGQDEAFDDLYRLHLGNVYRALGAEVPAFLAVPVTSGRRRATASAPTAFLDVTVDGRETSFFEWLFAGRYGGGGLETSSAPGGAMHRGEASVLRTLCFGFDAKRLFLRADLAPGWREAAGPLSLVFRLHDPHPASVTIQDVGAAPSTASVVGPAGRAVAAAAVGEIVEVSCDFAALGLAGGEEVALVLELWRGDVLVERLPGAETVRFAVPAEDFDASQWRV